MNYVCECEIGKAVTRHHPNCPYMIDIFGGVEEEPYYSDEDNQSIINELLERKLIYPIYENGSVIWIIEFPAGGEVIGSDGFSWDDICDLYRSQTT